MALGLWIPYPVLAEVAARAQVQTPTVEAIDDVLIVEWREKEIRTKDQSLYFRGGVIARYGPTVLRSETLHLFLADGERRGVAEGGVEINDPDGEARADRLEFRWLDRTGSGQNVTVFTPGLLVRAERMQLTPEAWTLSNVFASPDKSTKPLVALRARTVVFRPGGSGTAKPARIQVFGRTLVTVPSFRFGGRRDRQNLQIPSFNYNRGFGLTWDQTYYADDRSLGVIGLRAREGESTGLNLVLTRSLLPRREPDGLQAPWDDLGERFAFGYFDNVQTSRPSDERRAVATRRTSISVGYRLNGSASARRDRVSYSQPGYAVFEQAGTLSGIGFFSAIRWENVREEQEAVLQRTSVRGSLLAPAVEVAPGLRTHVRLDGQAYLGGNRFSWTQAQFGLVYRPNAILRVGAAAYVGNEFGRAPFLGDRLFSTGGYQVRFDADLGPTQFSYLAKYDHERRKWYDNEFAISQVAGSLEPYIGFREFPRTLTFGVRLRFDEIADRLNRRLTNTPRPKAPDD